MPSAKAGGNFPLDNRRTGRKHEEHKNRKPEKRPFGHVGRHLRLPTCVRGLCIFLLRVRVDGDVPRAAGRTKEAGRRKGRGGEKERKEENKK